MNNSKYAYGWVGHILVDKDEMESCEADNVVAVEHEKFAALLKAWIDDDNLDARVKIARLGITDSDTFFLACGHPDSFSEGYEHYGTGFAAADLCSQLPNPDDVDYRQAMREVYGLDLPPHRFMVGCSSEH